MNILIRFDGACFGNPGPMGIGVAIYSDGKLVKQVSEAIGHGTNNIAEYSAAIRGLEIAAKMHPQMLLVEGDSELIIMQLRGEYKIKNATLRLLHEKVKSLEKNFSAIEYRWIGREENSIADKLSKKALMA